ncbi:MarR family winged helix-turn-helix transcriptional regulator [Macrococcus animalis]|uniref:MarR family winged helix-turn-helix transcriptional regulator n=1 Tax=Macrococcus animalis TaxID=3395467 RepID=UPI0039BDB26E
MTESAQLFDYIVNIRRQYLDLMNKKLSTFQLSSAQWLVLKIIVQHAPDSITLVEISKLRHIEKPTATKLIQYLLEHQFIETHPSTDKRKKKLLPTPKGITTYQEVMNMVHDTQDSLTTSISNDTIKQINSDLAKLYNNLLTLKEKED